LNVVLFLTMANKHIIPRGASGLDRVQFCFRKSGKNLAVFIQLGA
jgi:hypothetical protein